jgi:hypothetical protein
MAKIGRNQLCPYNSPDERATALMRAGAVIQILLFPLRHKLKRDQ